MTEGGHSLMDRGGQKGDREGNTPSGTEGDTHSYQGQRGGHSLMDREGTLTHIRDRGGHSLMDRGGQKGDREGNTRSGTEGGAEGGMGRGGHGQKEAEEA